MRRISVVGISGSGKSYLARELAGALAVPCVELDAIHWRPGWVEAGAEEFAAGVAAAVAADAWVIDGNYSTVAQPLVWARADTVVWLDLPRRTVMRQIIVRTIRRIVTRAQVCGGGNTERWRNFFSLDPQESVIAWAWSRYAVQKERYTAALTDPAHARLTFIRVASRAQARHLVAQVSAAQVGSAQVGSAQVGSAGD